MAEEKKQEMLDPIAYREDFPKEYLTDYDPMADLTPEYLENMDYGKAIGGGNQSFSQYWDDSSPEYQQKAKWWLNDKYTGEGVKNDQLNYDANLMLKDLNPNFVYWLASKVYGTDHPWYITQRNDQIASALYNEWKTSKDDVAYFLWQQKWWMNSSEADRANTIEAVYKRLWAIAEQNPKEEEKPDLSKADNLVQDTSGKIYWKTTAEEWKPSKWIDTLADANSVFTSMQESRAANLKSLVSMSPDAVAELELSWVSPYWEQTMRDAQQLYPEFMAQVEAAKKKKLWQDNVNAIASWWEITTMADKVDTNSQATSYAVNNSSSSVSPTQLLKSIDERLIESDSAQSAKDLMLDIKNSEAQLKNRMRNLKQEANSKFKWDVPDYLVNAYINNKSQEIQNQLSILADRYSSAYEIYKTELAHAEWQSELDLKKDSLALEDWKAKNTTTSSTGTNNSNYTVAERNNNPTNMTVWFMQWAWAELWVDYEVSSDSFRSNGKQLYYAKLIWDPIDTTIRILDKAIAQWKNPFNTTSWSYINKLWLTVAKWNKMSQEEKQDMIRKWLPYEWWNMDNMAYYVSQKWSTQSYNEDDAPYYQKLLDADYTAISRPEKTAQTLLYWNVANFRAAALAWRDAEKKRIEDQAASKPARWKRKDWVEFDMADTPTYDTLTYDQQNIVQQLLNLNKNPATVTKRQYWDDFEKILSAVKEINPNWSDADYWQADKVKKEWNTSSKNGSNSRNGTAIATAMDIYDIADEFGNLKWKDWNGMLNKLKDKLSDEAYTKLLINLEVLASEYAWALKGNNAAPTEQEINDKKEILAANLWTWAMKEAAIQIAKTLYNKNANEADNYYNVTLTKPPLVVTKDVADRMYNTAWIKTLPDKYQYTPKWMSSWWWNAPLTWSEYTYEWGILSAINQNKRKWKRF